jgi:GH24 family phage-related lysozyme (muramidase)
MKVLPPDAIVGSVFVQVSLSCIRRIDQMQGKQAKVYTFVFSADHIGSGSIVNSMPAEMDEMVNQCVRTVGRWEYRARKAREDAAKIHTRPGTEPVIMAGDVLPKGQAHRRPGI